MSKYPYIVIIRVFLCRKKMKGPGHIPGLYCVRQSNVTPFCENYAKLYFDAKHLEKGLNRGGEESALSGQYQTLPKIGETTGVSAQTTGVSGCSFRSN